MGPSLKLAVISATVVSTAIMFNLLSPFIMNFTITDLHIIWTAIISWLEPPYLYVVINGIIITLFASSRLQSKLDGCDHSVTTLATSTSTEPVKVELLPPVHVPVPQFQSGLENEPVDIALAGYTSESNSKFIKVPESEFEFDTPELADEEIKEQAVDKSVILMSACWTPSDMNEVGLSFPVEKPPASARFSHRKPAKATSEGGKTLGVAKPKRQDTLETTWKTIIEGRSVPLTRHLRKSDTWETHGPRPENLNSDEFSTDNHTQRMKKSETFDVNRGGGVSLKPVKPPPSQSVKPPASRLKLRRSGGSGRLRKDPSLGQEELNRRVEAFIKKFNEDMRLQRQESLNRFMEMINRGAH